MTVFETTLLEQLYGENSTSNSSLANLSAASFVSGPTIIDDYTLAEPYWWVGNWDASACEAHCDGDGDGVGQQTGEVFCSRGLWLACSGLADEEVGYYARHKRNAALRFPSLAALQGPGRGNGGGGPRICSACHGCGQHHEHHRPLVFHFKLTDPAKSWGGGLADLQEKQKTGESTQF